MKRIGTSLLISALMIAPTVSMAPGAAQAATVLSGALNIPAAKISLNVYRTDTLQEAQVSIDSCRGATALPAKLVPGVTWLAAHRTSCGSRGFGGVEKLKAGTRFTMSINGSLGTYEIINDGIVTTTTTGLSEPRPAGTVVVLQTSKSTSKKANPYYLYLKFARLVSTSKSATAEDVSSASDTSMTPSIADSSPVDGLSTGSPEVDAANRTPELPRG